MKYKCFFCHRLGSFSKPGDSTLTQSHRHIIHFVTFSHILLSKHLRGSIELGEKNHVRNQQYLGLIPLLPPNDLNKWLLSPSLHFLP